MSNLCSIFCRKSPEFPVQAVVSVSVVHHLARSLVWKTRQWRSININRIHKAQRHHREDGRFGGQKSQGAVASSVHLVSSFYFLCAWGDDVSVFCLLKPKSSCGTAVVTSSKHIAGQKEYVGSLGHCDRGHCSGQKSNLDGLRDKVQLN